MRLRRAACILFPVLICVALAACDLAGEALAGGGTPAPASTAASTPHEPTPIPTPTPTPTPAPTPTPTPEPTPTPDPWADKFHTGGGAYISYKDFNNGPWLYKDANLSVEIQRLEGSRHNIYYKAEIYARGALFTRGLSFKTLANPGKGKTEYPYKIARRYDAVFGITADYYTIKRRGVVLIGGETYRDEKKNSTLAIMPDGSLKAYGPGEITAAELLEMGVMDSLSFGPILVTDGKIDKDSIKKHFLPDKRDYRTAIGQVEPGHYIAIVSKGSFTLTEFAQLFIDNGCTMAYNLDGGHSACMVFMGEQLNQLFMHKSGVRQRPMPDLLFIGCNAAVPDVKDKVYSNGTDIFAKNKPKPTDGILPEATATPGN